MISNAQSLTFKQSQKVNVNQIQFLNLLYLNQQELECRITQELLENPFLEQVFDSNPESEERINEDDDFMGELRLEEVYAREDLEDGHLSPENTGRENSCDYHDYLINSLSEEPSIKDSILDQLRFKGLTEEKFSIAYFLVNSVTEKGFLDSKISDITDNYCFATGKFTDEATIEEVKNIINNCEPRGFACYDLQDYLIFMIKHDSAVPEVDKYRALLILQNYFLEFTSHEWEKIELATGIEFDKVSEVLTIIASHSPYPTYGNETGGEVNIQVIPDYELYLEEGELKGSLVSNKNYNFTVNTHSAEALRTDSGNSTQNYINSRLTSAFWLLDAIKQRENTMTKVIEAIAKIQGEYLISGEKKHLKPMILKDISEITGLEISTISRVTSNKYAISPIGIINLKSLFSEAIYLENGEAISNKEVQERVVEMIENEDKSKPMSDLDIQKELQKSGIFLTRRTITKYRVVERIPASGFRKI